MNDHDESSGPRLSEIRDDGVWRQFPDGCRRITLPPRWTDTPFADLDLPDATGDHGANPTGPTTTAETLYQRGIHTVGEFRAWLAGAEITGQSVVGPHGDSMVSCSLIRVRSLIRRLSSQLAERDRAVHG